MKNALILAAAVLAAPPALACQYDMAPEPIAQPSATYFARQMVPHAATIDLAVAEQSRPLNISPIAGLDPQATTFRVIERWKGMSPDRFTLFTAGGRGSGFEPEPSHFVSDEGHVDPFPYPHEANLASLGPGSSCDPGVITPSMGRLYLVFREVDGRLLGAVPMRGGARTARLFPLVIAGLPQDEKWFDAVRQATWMLREGSLKDTNGGIPARNRARIVFRKPLTGAQARSLLTSAGVVPVAASVRAGDLIDETRLPDDYASLALIERALTNARANLASSSPLTRTAAALQYRFKEAVGTSDDAITRLVLAMSRAQARLAEARRAGLSGISSVEVVGTPTQLARLRHNVSVAQYLPGFSARNRQGTPNEPRARGDDPTTARTIDQQAVLASLSALVAER
jgi:hypothetical protein